MTAAHRWHLRAAVLAVLALLAGPALAGCGVLGGAGSVIVAASWSNGTEETNFHAVLDEFTAETGIGYTYQGSRAVSQLFSSGVRTGTAADVVALPSPGELAAYQRQGVLHPLDDVLDAATRAGYDPQWLRIAGVGTGRLYAVPIKADLKSAVWYDPARLTGPAPRTWDELIAASIAVAAAGTPPWCVGLSAPPTSGWPGTDWIEDLLLQQAGPQAYQAWAAGRTPWTAPEVRDAWLRWGRIVGAGGLARGGPTAVLLTDFGMASGGTFAQPPRCAFTHQASSVIGGYRGQARAAGRDPDPTGHLDFFPFPGPSPAGPPATEVSADLAALVHDTPQARRLMQFLAGPAAQRIWPALGDGRAFSVNRTVPAATYPDPVSRRVAQALSSPSTSLCFDASDLMPATMTYAFYRAVAEFVQDPTRLDTVLGELDQVRRSIPAGDWLNLPCG